MGDDNEYSIQIRVGPLSGDDLDVSVNNGVLSVSGRTESRDEREEDGYSIFSCSCSSFNYRRVLPSDVDGGNLESSVEDGVLSISAPRRLLPAPKPEED
ncbi:Hsp20/alpha crystallin family protein [archaeon]|jgi:HSP20 family protein|nr:Hsp20/alpha crystallin family protein [archaeon]MBT6955977.1 Hsp20/alpha crystallin family protein [archaeon]MBT7567880.1 Hsp20/alpha crystallin family protein [archaeon]